MHPFQFGSVFQQPCSSIDIWQATEELQMEYAVMALEILGKMFTRHMLVEPLCFIRNESCLIQSDRPVITQCSCIPKYSHSITESVTLVCILPFLVPPFLLISSGPGQALCLMCPSTSSTPEMRSPQGLVVTGERL